MFGDIGMAELLVVALVVVLVTRPQDLPVMMRRLGLMTAFVQSFIGGIWGGWQEKLGLFSTQNEPTPRDDKAGGGR